MFRKSQGRQAVASVTSLRTSGAGFPGKHPLPAPQHQGKVDKALQTTKSIADEPWGGTSPPKGAGSLPQDAKPFLAWEKRELCKGITREAGVRLPSSLPPSAAVFQA